MLIAFVRDRRQLPGRHGLYGARPSHQVRGLRRPGTASWQSSTTPQPSTKRWSQRHSGFWSPAASASSCPPLSTGRGRRADRPGVHASPLIFAQRGSHRFDPTADQLARLARYRWAAPTWARRRLSWARDMFSRIVLRRADLARRRRRRHGSRRHPDRNRLSASPCPAFSAAGST